MINTVIFNGRLIKDPQLKELENNNVVVRFMVAVNRSFKNGEGDYDADYVPCFAWGDKGRAYAKNLKKGSLVGVKGVLRSRSYEDNGKKNYSLEVQVEEVDFLSSKTTTEQTPGFKFNEDPLG